MKQNVFKRFQNFFLHEANGSCSLSAMTRASPSAQLESCGTVESDIFCSCATSISIFFNTAFSCVVTLLL